MGEVGDEGTMQQQYYGMLGFYERYSDSNPHYAARAEKMRKIGPPPFEAADGVVGKAVYYTHRAKQGDEDAARIVEELRAEHPEVWASE